MDDLWYHSFCCLSYGFDSAPGPLRFYGSMLLRVLISPPEYLFLLILLPFIALLATILLPVLPVSKAPFLPFPRLL